MGINGSLIHQIKHTASYNGGMKTVKYHRIIFYSALCIYGVALLWMFYGKVVFGFANQASSCLYAEFFIIDKEVDEVQRGELAMFKFVKDAVVLAPGDRLIKIVAGVPGDTITFNENELFVNGNRFYKAKSMQVNLKTLGHTIDDYQTKYTLKDNEYFMVGETPDSFDSRYWGPITQSQIEGEAYAIY